MSALENRAAEAAVLGAILQDAEALKAARTLRTGDFSDPAHQSIYIVCKRLMSRGEPVDLTTAAGELAKAGSAVTAADLISLIRQVPSTVNAGAYIRAVREAAQRRAIAEIGRKLMENAASDGWETSNLLDSVRSELRSIAGGGEGWMTAAELADATLAFVEAKQNGTLPLIQTGLSDLDWLIGGFAEGELEIIGARPGVGKTALAMQLILHACKGGKKVALVSQEMGPHAIGERMVSRLSGVEGSKLRRKGKLDPDDWVDVMDGLNLLSQQPFVSQYNVRSVEQLWQDVQSLYDRQGLDMLVVDYLQLVHSSSRTQNRSDEIEIVVNELKAMAMELRIPVIGLAQVRRTGSREAVMPVMDELKGSGAIEQAASKIILLHRPESDDDECLDMHLRGVRMSLEDAGQQLILADVAKHREGKTGMVSLVFKPDEMSYVCLRA
jgi:replicative DNA helicase